jgi:hypothetical protein
MMTDNFDDAPFLLSSPSSHSSEDTHKDVGHENPKIAKTHFHLLLACILWILSLSLSLAQRLKKFYRTKSSISAIALHLVSNLRRCHSIRLVILFTVSRPFIVTRAVHSLFFNWKLLYVFLHIYKNTYVTNKNKDAWIANPFSLCLSIQQR